MIRLPTYSDYLQYLQGLITDLVAHEDDLDAKLDLLTNISIGATNEDIHKAAEAVRSGLLKDTEEDNGLRGDLPVARQEDKSTTKGDQGISEPSPGADKDK